MSLSDTSYAQFCDLLERVFEKPEKDVQKGMRTWYFIYVLRCQLYAWSTEILSGTCRDLTDVITCAKFCINLLRISEYRWSKLRSPQERLMSVKPHLTCANALTYTK